MGIGTTNFRSFEREAGVVAYVTAFQNNKMLREIDTLSIDQRTGKITLPAFAKTFAGLADKGEVQAVKDQLVSHFTLQIMHGKDDRVVVLQREKGNRYRSPQTTVNFGDDGLVLHTEPPCEMKWRIRSSKEQAEHGLPPVAAWTDTQMQVAGGSNRADVIRVQEDGTITLFRIVIVTLDDGKSFSVIGEVGGVWSTYRRTTKKPYVLRSDDPRKAVVFGNSEVRDLLNRYVFVPEYGYPSIEGWLEMLDVRAVRELITSATVADEWDEPENFWLIPEPKVKMTEDDQAVVQWFVYGTGGAAMGYVRFNKPAVIDGRPYPEAQIRHYSVDSPVDAQGRKIIPAGSIVKVHRVVAQAQPHPPIAYVGLQYAYREEGEENPEDEQDGGSQAAA